MVLAILSIETLRVCKKQSDLNPNQSLLLIYLAQLIYDCCVPAAISDAKLENAGAAATAGGGVWLYKLAAHI